LAVVAIAQHWTPSMVYASGFGMGIVWTVFALIGVMKWIAKVTPDSVIRGIQVALGIILAIEAIKMISTWWIIGVLSIITGLVLGRNRYAPAAIVLMALGLVIMIVKGQFNLVESPRLTLPNITGFSPREVWQSFLQAGFAQIPLTATNAVIATSALIKSYWPEKPVSESRLSLNMGIMNLILPFFGGMPLCHGAGGLAGQYYFGARTGGANIIEGLIEIAMGLFLAGSIAGLLSVFPVAIIGAMMFLVGVELVKFARGIHWGTDIIPMGTTLIVSLLTNMAYGFLSGFVVYYLIKSIPGRKNA
ncbi:MAG: putative sulfate/molybdate transporter, partial [Syntrophorhabdus sp.]